MFLRKPGPVPCGAASEMGFGNAQVLKNLEDALLNGNIYFYRHGGSRQIGY